MEPSEVDKALHVSVSGNRLILFDTWVFWFTSSLQNHYVFLESGQDWHPLLAMDYIATSSALWTIFSFCQFVTRCQLWCCLVSNNCKRLIERVHFKFLNKLPMMHCSKLSSLWFSDVDIIQLFKSLYQILLLVYLSIFNFQRPWQVTLAVILIVFLSPVWSLILVSWVSFIVGLCYVTVCSLRLSLCQHLKIHILI